MVYLSQIYGSTISFAYFRVFFLKILMVKNSPIYTKNIYDLTTAIINKCFEFQNDWLKIIPVRYNCTQFCPIPLC